MREEKLNHTEDQKPRFEQINLNQASPLDPKKSDASRLDVKLNSVYFDYGLAVDT